MAGENGLKNDSIENAPIQWSLVRRLRYVNLGMLNHDLLFNIIEKYGAPPKLIAANEKCYQDLVVFLMIKKGVTELP